MHGRDPRALNTKIAGGRDAAARFQEALGEAAYLLGGVHVVRADEFPTRAAGGNYLRKMATVLSLCRRAGYTTVLSIDDDVLLSPAALAARSHA